MKLLKGLLITEVLISLFPFIVPFLHLQRLITYRDPYPMLILTFLVIGTLFVSMRLVLFFGRQIKDKKLRLIVAAVVLTAGFVITLEGTYMTLLYRKWSIYIPYFVILIFYLLRFYFPARDMLEG